MNQEYNDWHSKLPAEGLSTTDFLATFAESVISDMDLITSAPKEAVLAKASTIKASQISGARENLTQHYPAIDDMFAGALTAALEQIATGSEVNGAQLFEAYGRAVNFVRSQTTKQFSHLMLMPGAVGDFLGYFDVPINKEIVSELDSSNPDLATQYRDRAKRWTGDA